MKSVFSSRRNKIPHNNEGKERKEAPFFTKESKKPFFNMTNGGAIQTKLSIGQPGDKYEKEADTMADAVVNKTVKPDVQKKRISSIQRESLATPQEDEKLGTAEQRMEEDKLVQEKPEIQKMDAPEEEIINKMDASEEKEEPIQKMGDQEEEMINKMEEGGEKEEEELVQTKGNPDNQKASSSLSNRIEGKAGKGKKMPKGIKTEMETSFGKDFSQVNIHTDQDAITMNKELGAQAFTHGKDIYFNSGKFNPESTQGKHLLAHELTHIIQQNESIQRKKNRKWWQFHIPLLHDDGSDYKKISLTYDGRFLHVFGDGKKLQSITAQSGKFESVDDKIKKKCSGGILDRYLNNPKYVGIKDKGAIPEGTYQFRPKSIQDFTAKDQKTLLTDMFTGKKTSKTSHGNVKTGDWGSGRVHLIPVSSTIKKSSCGNTKGRSGFFLHGGILPGSAGCIDIGSSFNMLSRFLSTYKKTIKLKVAYANKGKWIGWL